MNTSLKTFLALAALTTLSWSTGCNSDPGAEFSIKVEQLKLISPQEAAGGQPYNGTAKVCLTFVASDGWDRGILGPKECADVRFASGVSTEPFTVTTFVDAPSVFREKYCYDDFLGPIAPAISIQMKGMNVSTTAKIAVKSVDRLAGNPLKCRGEGAEFYESLLTMSAAVTANADSADLFTHRVDRVQLEEVSYNGFRFLAQTGEQVFAKDLAAAQVQANQLCQFLGYEKAVESSVLVTRGPTQASVDLWFFTQGHLSHKVFEPFFAASGTEYVRPQFLENHLVCERAIPEGGTWKDTGPLKIDQLKK